MAENYTLANRAVDTMADAMRRAYVQLLGQSSDLRPGQSDKGITVRLVGDWHNNSSGMTEARIIIGQSKAGFHHAVDVRVPGTDALPRKWIPAVTTRQEAWTAAVAYMNRMLSYAPPPNRTADALATDAVRKMPAVEGVVDRLGVAAQAPSQAQRNAARQATPAIAPSQASANRQGQQQVQAATRAARL